MDAGQSRLPEEAQDRADDLAGGDLRIGVDAGDRRQEIGGLVDVVGGDHADVVRHPETAIGQPEYCVIF